MSKMFFAGVPTGADVRKLKDAFGVPEAGTEITHDQIEAVIGVERTEHRYRTVVAAWRKALMNENNVDLGTVAGAGYRALSAPERVSAGIHGMRAGVRKQIKSIRRASLATTEDAALMNQQAALQRYGIALANQANATLKQLGLTKPGDQNPTRTPPGQ